MYENARSIESCIVLLLHLSVMFFRSVDFKEVIYLFIILLFVFDVSMFDVYINLLMHVLLFILNFDESIEDGT